MAGGGTLPTRGTPRGPLVRVPGAAGAAAGIPVPGPASRPASSNTRNHRERGLVRPRSGPVGRVRTGPSLSPWEQGEAWRVRGRVRPGHRGRRGCTGFCRSFQGLDSPRSGPAGAGGTGRPYGERQGGQRWLPVHPRPLPGHPRAGEREARTGWRGRGIISARSCC